MEAAGQHHLTQDQQIGDAAFASQADDEDRRQYGQGAGDQPPHPGLDSPMHEAFHHDLPGQGAGDGAALSAGEQRDGKQRARNRGPQQRRQGQVRHSNPIAVGA